MKKSLIEILLIIFILSLAFVFVKDFIKTKNNNPIKITFLGDSITEFGWTEDIGYIKLTVKELINKGVQVKPIPNGVKGNTSYDILQRINTDAIKNKPDFLILMIGMNDALGEPEQIQHFKDNMQQIINILKENNIKTIILNITITENNLYYANDAINEHNKILSELTQFQGIELIDINSVFKDTINKMGKNIKKEYVLTKDGVHLNNLGNKILSDTIVKYLQP